MLFAIITAIKGSVVLFLSGIVFMYFIFLTIIRETMKVKRSCDKQYISLAIEKYNYIILKAPFKCNAENLSQFLVLSTLGLVYL